MTLNVRKHESEILSAYNEVLNSSDNQKWLILDYEGNSNVLKIGEKGDDGIEELSMSFNSGKLQYGIASIKSAASSQPKMILIQWQGEGVPTSRLAVTTSHANDLKRFLRGIHVVIIARSEDDVDKESILKVVAKLPTMNDLRGIGGSSEATDKDSQRQGPIGSVYTPIKPNRDIDLSERDKFWRNIETEEANRQLAEQRRATEKAAEADRDRDELTKQIHQKLDINGDHVEARETSRLNSIAHQNTVQKRVMDFGGGDGQRANAHSSSSSPPPTSLGDSLIRGRKAMFEQKANELRNEQSLSPHPTKSRQPKSSVSPPINAQSSINKPSAQFVPSSPSFRTEIGSSSQSSTANHRNVPQQNQSNPVPPLPSSSSPSNPSDHATSYIPSPKMQTPPSNENSSNQPKAGYSNAVMNELKSALPAANQSATTIPSYDMANQSTDDQQKHSQPQQPSSYYEEPPLDEENEQNYATEQHTDLRAIALWDYQAADDTEITFDPDDIITEIEQIDEGWWRGRGPDGTVGLFPANYVSIL